MYRIVKICICYKFKGKKLIEQEETHYCIYRPTYIQPNSFHTAYTKKMVEALLSVFQFYFCRIAYLSVYTNICDNFSSLADKRSIVIVFHLRPLYSIQLLLYLVAVGISVFCIHVFWRARVCVCFVDRPNQKTNDCTRSRFKIMCKLLQNWHKW